MPTLTVLYTHDLRGDIHALPRFATLIQHARAQAERVVCVDLGGACDPSAWHCDVTGGRSMLAALDGCGYAAAYTDSLTPEGRVVLNKAILSMQMVDDAHPARVGGMAYQTRRQSDSAADVTLYLRPAEITAFEGDLLTLAAIPRLHLGIMTVDIAARDIVHRETVPLTPHTRPDATISGVVDFILSEARLYQKRQARP
jgi:hypothetical protein